MEDIEGTHPWKAQLDPQMPDSDSESGRVMIEFCSHVADEPVSTLALCFL